MRLGIAPLLTHKLLLKALDVLPNNEFEGLVQEY